MSNFLKELWLLLGSYKFRGHYSNGTEAFAIPLSWLTLFDSFPALRLISVLCLQNGETRRELYLRTSWRRIRTGWRRIRTG